MDSDTETLDVRSGAPTPTFSEDPHGWLEHIRDALHEDHIGQLMRQVEPAVWANDRKDGHAWRIVRTDTGFEIRPELVNPFLRHGESPKVTALCLGEDVAVELTCRTGRWVDRFPFDTFDVVGLAHAMLEEQSLPHDNLPQLFPPHRS